MNSNAQKKIHRALAAIVTSLCLLTVDAAAQASEVPAFVQIIEASEREPIVVCFGDSVTGVYYHTGGRRAYTDMLAIALRAAYPGTAFNAINAGISGHTTADALARIERDVLAHKPDLVTVMFGLNDMTRVPIGAFEANLRSIVHQCRAIGAEVLLCTPNSVRDTSDRPVATLEQYVEAIRAVARDEQAPLIDCYRAFEDVRKRDPLEWAFLMSDAIHPNMDGHKLIAEEIARAIVGTPVSLVEADPLPVAIPHTIKQLQDGNPIHLVAMPPYDSMIPSAIKTLWPDAQLNVSTWPVAGRSLADIEAHSKEIRGMNPDLVLVAVPIDAASDSIESFIQSYSWVLNNSFAFATSQWDCVAVSPSLLNPELAAGNRDRDMQRLIRAQDLAAIKRGDSQTDAVEDVLKHWLSEQLALYEEKR